MSNEKISNGAGALIIALATMTNAFSVMPGSSAGRWVWVSDLIALALSVLVVWTLTFICDKFPSDSFCGALYKLVGKKVGAAVGVIFSFLALLSCVVSLTVFSRFVRLTALPQTSQIIIPLLIATVSALSVSKGLSSCEGAARLLFLFVLAVFVFFSISGIPHIEKSLILPKGRNAESVLAGAGEVFLNRFGYIPAFMTVYTRMSERDTRKKYALFSVVAVGVIFALISLITVSALGENTSSADFFPVYTAMSLHSVGGFIQHTEIFACIAMVLCLYFKGSVCLAFSDDILGEISRTRRKYGVALPLALICAASTQIIYRDVSSLQRMLEWKSGAGIIFMLNILLPLILFLICLLKRKNFT